MDREVLLVTSSAVAKKEEKKYKKIPGDNVSQLPFLDNVMMHY